MTAAQMQDKQQQNLEDNNVSKYHVNKRYNFFFYILCNCISSEVLRCSTDNSPRNHWEAGSKWRHPDTGIENLDR